MIGTGVVVVVVDVVVVVVVVVVRLHSGEIGRFWRRRYKHFLLNAYAMDE